MTCPFEYEKCPHREGVHEVLHYMCRTCTANGCETKVSTIGAAQCTPCMLKGISK